VPLSTDLFDYALPPGLVAQTPTAQRDQSRLMVIDRAAHSLAHHVFADLPKFLRSDDVLIRNNASVLPARLLAHRPTGGAVECFLLHDELSKGWNIWTCLVKPGKKLPPGATFSHGSAFTGTILAKEDNGCALVRFFTADDEPITRVANRLGQIPLPPYIEREGTPTERVYDIERYQTVYADHAKQVAVAAPTAGLHFTPELLSKLTESGITIAELTLHVGLGTFKPITAPVIEEHAIHREIYELPPATQRVLFSSGRRRIAVGTTSVRSIEDFLSRHDSPSTQAHIGEADIFIYPPRSFRGIDALITNFHQPRSTLLCLVAAFLTPGSTEGIAWIREIYDEAIAQKYRFFSYGDAMLII
jgi:S-adenosylmethionine:tRNA ribosyltransferase-isomerase